MYIRFDICTQTKGLKWVVDILKNTRTRFSMELRPRRANYMQI